jgi:hypothetical protein
MVKLTEKNIIKSIVYMHCLKIDNIIKCKKNDIEYIFDINLSPKIKLSYDFYKCIELKNEYTECTKIVNFNPLEWKTIYYLTENSVIHKITMNGMEYNYVVKAVKYDEHKYTSSIDEYYYKSTRNIEILFVMIMLYGYLYYVKSMKIYGDIESRKDIDENYKKLLKEKKITIDDIIRNINESYTKLLTKKKITFDRIISVDWIKIIQISNLKKNSGYKQESDNAKEFIEIQKIYDTNIRKEFKELSKNQRELIEIYLVKCITKILLEYNENINSLVINKFINFVHTYTIFTLKQFVNVEHEQTLITGVPEHEEYYDQSMAPAAERCGQGNTFYYMMLYEGDITKINNLVISMYSVNLPSGLRNFYICKNIRYLLNKLFKDQKELSNSALKIHSFSLYYFGKQSIYTFPVGNMDEIFKKPEHKLNFINISGTPEYNKLVNEENNFLYNNKVPDYGEYRCPILTPEYRISPQSDSSFPNYWKII